jgi:hypothetical protein
MIGSLSHDEKLAAMDLVWRPSSFELKWAQVKLCR